jgi:Ca2+-binding EF-hand superfamily protein
MGIRKRSILTALALMLTAPAPAWSQSLLKTLDPDNDGTVDLAEAKSAASKLFDKLDRDHDGTLDKRELRGRLNAKDFAAGDPDNDGTLDKNEFLVLMRNASRLPILTMTERSTLRSSRVPQAVPWHYS